MCNKKAVLVHRSLCFVVLAVTCYLGHVKPPSDDDDDAVMIA